MAIVPGTQAPDFSLPDENNVTRQLSDFHGRPVVLYFYPKDDTAGCTAEACGFRDDYASYVNSDLVIIGVSPDSPRAHAKFKTKYSLPFSLLADEGHVVCEKYGVWGLKKFMGRTYEGVLRTTFLIDSDGRIAKVFKNVRPAEHAAEVIGAAKKLWHI
jgi:thioredoxin-dependent peroxiredoxin